jgi:hypothetical protein
MSLAFCCANAACLGIAQARQGMAACFRLEFHKHFLELLACLLMFFFAR